MFALWQRNLSDTQKSWSADKLDAILWTDTYTHTNAWLNALLTFWLLSTSKRWHQNKKCTTSHCKLLTSLSISFYTLGFMLYHSTVVWMPVLQQGNSRVTSCSLLRLHSGKLKEMVFIHFQVDCVWSSRGSCKCISVASPSAVNFIQIDVKRAGCLFDLLNPGLWVTPGAFRLSKTISKSCGSWRECQPNMYKIAWHVYAIQKQMQAYQTWTLKMRHCMMEAVLKVEKVVAAGRF